MSLILGVWATVVCGLANASGPATAVGRNASAGQRANLVARKSPSLGKSLTGVPCTKKITGVSGHGKTIVVGRGETLCVVHAHLTAGITVNPGGRLSVAYSTITGHVGSNGGGVSFSHATIRLPPAS